MGYDYPEKQSKKNVFCNKTSLYTIIYASITNVLKYTGDIRYKYTGFILKRTIHFILKCKIYSFILSF